MTVLKAFTALSSLDLILMDFEMAKNGLNKVVLVNGVPTDATHYDTFGGVLTHHLIDAKGSFYSDGVNWVRHHKGFEPWTVTKIGHFEPPRTNGPNLPKVVIQDQSQREVEYYRKGSKRVGD